MIEVFGLRTTPFYDDDFYNCSFDLIPVKKQQKIKRYRQKEDAMRSLAGEILVRYLLLNRCAVSMEKLVFEENEYGKPHLLGYNNIHFNLSHSGDYVVCAIDDKPVGIDLEEITEFDYDIVQRAFTEQEYIYIMDKPTSERKEAFFDVWTLKESYIKAVGCGLSMPLESLCVHIGNEIKVSTQKGFEKYYLRQMQIDRDYKLAVCAENMDFCQQTIMLDINQIIAKQFT